MNVEEIFNQGVNKTELGNFQAAIAEFNTALRRDTTFVDAYYNRGLAHSQLGNPTRAIANYSRE